MTRSLSSQILMFRQGDCDKGLELIEQFSPLHKRFARLLGSEDAFNDLQLDFLIILKNIPDAILGKASDGEIVNYLKTSVKNAYILLSKKAKANVPLLYYEDVINKDQLAYNEGSFEVSGYDGLFMEDLRQILSPKEFAIIIKHYFYDFTIAEIAAQQHVTRQTINQVKLSALKKLKAFWG